MVHTYHKYEKGVWTCANEDHQIFLRLRQDPWIKEFRKAGVRKEVTVKQTGR
jgi:hypothetical protein